MGIQPSHTLTLLCYTNYITFYTDITCRSAFEQYCSCLRPLLLHWLHVSLIVSQDRLHSESH